MQARLAYARKAFRRGAPLTNAQMELIAKYGAETPAPTLLPSPPSETPPPPATLPSEKLGWGAALIPVAQMAALMLL